MKGLVLVGIVLAVLGGVVVFRGASVGSRRDVVDVGDVHVSTTEQHVIPVWVGGVALVGGALLAIGAVMRRGA